MGLKCRKWGGEGGENSVEAREVEREMERAWM